MSEGLDIGHGVTIPLDEIELRASRSGGPGGQHANVTASRIEAIFEVRASGSLPPALRDRIASRLGPRVTAVAQESRGQARNRAIALERLRARLADAAAPRKQRRPTKPGRAAHERRLTDKRRQSERKRRRRRPREEW